MITNECKAISKMVDSRLSGKKVLVTEAGQLSSNGDKARQCLGWSLQVDLKEGLQRMIDRFRVPGGPSVTTTHIRCSGA